MKTTIYECDRCHKKATTKEEIELLALGTVSVGFKIGGGSYSSPEVYAAYQIWEKEMCRACRAEIGCLEDKKKEYKQAPDNTPSLEDMVREIVRQEFPPQH